MSAYPTQYIESKERVAIHNSKLLFLSKILKGAYLGICWISVATSVHGCASEHLPIGQFLLLGLVAAIEIAEALRHRPSKHQRRTASSGLDKWIKAVAWITFSFSYGCRFAHLVGGVLHQLGLCSGMWAWLTAPSVHLSLLLIVTALEIFALTRFIGQLIATGSRELSS